MNDTQHQRNGSATLSPLPADTALNTYFHEARAKLLDVAAFLDRISRGPNAAAVANDPRLAKIRQALAVLHDESAARAEMIQQIFSLDYDPAWQVPQPRSTIATV
jgi:hypothetical protein